MAERDAGEEQCPRVKQDAQVDKAVRHGCCSPEASETQGEEQDWGGAAWRERRLSRAKCGEPSGHLWT